VLINDPTLPMIECCGVVQIINDPEYMLNENTARELAQFEREVDETRRWRRRRRHGG
jgi:hypothetical protein